MEKLEHLNEIMSATKRPMKIQTLQKTQGRLRKEKKDTLARLKALEVTPDLSMNNELAAIEAEMDKVTKSDISLDEESVLLKEQLEKLKAICKKMAVIEEEKGMLAAKTAFLQSLVDDLHKENQVLKKQKQQIQEELMGGSGRDEAALKNRIIDLEGELQLLRSIKDERDSLLNENAGLKQHLNLSHDELKQEVFNCRKKVKELQDKEISQNLNFEVEDVRNRLESYSDIEQKLIVLKQKADAADKLKIKLLDSLHLCDAVSLKCNEMEQKLEILKNAGVDVDGLVLGRIQRPQGALEAYKESIKKIEALERAGVDVDGIISGKVSYTGKAAEQKIRFLTSKLEATIKERDDLIIERAALASDSQESLSHLLHKLEATMKEQGALKQDKEYLKGERDALKLELESQKEQHDYYISLEQRLIITRSERDALQKRVNELELKAVNTQSLIAERDTLRMKLDDYDGINAELERLRHRAKEADILRIERNSMKMRLDELSSIEVALQEKTTNMEIIASERELFKRKYEKVAALEPEIDDLRKCFERLKGADKENDLLKGQIRDLQCVIADQEHEAERMLNCIDRLSLENEKQVSTVNKGQVHTNIFFILCPETLILHYCTYSNIKQHFNEINIDMDWIELPEIKENFGLYLSHCACSSPPKLLMLLAGLYGYAKAW
ncbi:uncharacterized protein [Periplaneta americana]|uniref:uncharacterized protein n=1 Tax=Periplaneta americana TaxID=6978 RepID=UPI0037E9B1F3